VLVIITIMVMLAIPQYRLIVYKAQGAEAKRILRAVSESGWRYYLQNGEFTLSLDLEIPKSKYFWYNPAVINPPLGGFSVEAVHIEIYTLYDNGVAVPSNIPIIYGCMINQDAIMGGVVGQELGHGYYRHYYTYKVREGSSFELGSW